MGVWWILARAGGRAPLLVVPLIFVRVCVLLRKARRWRLPEDGINVSLPSPHSGGASSIVGGRVEVSPADLSSVDLLGSGYCSSIFVCLRVGSFRSTLFFIGGGCCSVALFLWSLSTTTSRLSTTTSFARLRRGRGDNGAAPSARLRACSRR
jgi:hypothetical protein